LRFHDLRALQRKANAAHAEEGVFFLGDRPIRQRFIAAHIEGAHHQRATVEAVEHTPVFGFLGGFVRRLRMGHENQLGTQQTDAFGALLHRVGHAGAFADVGEHFHGVTVTGHRRLMALGRGDLQALFTGIALDGGALQRIGISIHMQAAALAIEQQRRAGGQQQH